MKKKRRGEKHTFECREYRAEMQRRKMKGPGEKEKADSGVCLGSRRRKRGGGGGQRQLACSSLESSREVKY